MNLIPVSTPEHVEWLRVKRSDPRLYKYFRQDMPITTDQQAKWWRNLDKTTVRLFIVERDGEKVGYVGFNPLYQRGGRAEFGIFIVPEYEGNGYGSEALSELLKIGFTQLNLSTIYSDVLDYPGENRWDFYEKLGFEKFPDDNQGIRYKKQGKWVNSIKFFMTKDSWEKHGKDGDVGLGPIQAPQVVAKKRGRPKGSSLHTGPNRV